MKKQLIAFTGLTLLLVLFACSTEKNTLISRSYHGMTAHYNGYFNANDLLREAMTTYRAGLKEDFYKILPITPLPDEEAVKNMYTPIDTAISKSAKVIQRHAMPSMDEPSKKKDEFNKWIDENWLTIGIANYYRRDYPLAMKNFEYTKKFFSNDRTTYLAEIWMARTYIQERNFTEAGFNLANLDKVVDDQYGTAEEREGKGKLKLYLDYKKKARAEKKKSKKKKKNKEDGAPPRFTNKLRFELELTRGMLAEAKGDREMEEKALTESLKFVKKSSDKARIHFILGQLAEQRGDRMVAAEHYGKVLKYNAPFEMQFNARLKRALNGGTEKVKLELNKMARDTKNAEFRDQIYYTLGLIAQQENDEPKAVEQFTKSAFYSTANNQQKGLAYERLGDISFRKKDYVRAQKYYDSCATVIPPTYPNADGVKNKAIRLEDLVEAIETAHYEDSVQRIAALSENDRFNFAEKVIKQMKEEEARQKQRDEKRAADLQAAAVKPSASGSKWYFSNPKVVQEGLDEFKRQWGQRENEDDWRRSEKVSFTSFTEKGGDTIAGSDPGTPTKDVAADSLTPELLLAKLPLSDSSLASSRERMMAAYFDAGQIYQEQLNERALATQQYKTILGKPFESDYKLLAAYQIYRMNDPNSPEAQEQRAFIFTNYPTSDYAGYLRDPDYFLKKKERDKLVEQEYITDLQRFEGGLYYPVITKADIVIRTQKDNSYRAKYYLLKARSLAKVSEDKRVLLPVLDSLIMEYPGTPEAAKAADMKNIITKGYSKNEPADFSKKSIYTYEENVSFSVLIFLEKGMTSNAAKIRVADFNKEFFGRDRLNTSSKVYGASADQSVIVVKEFKNENEAAMYLSTYKKTKKHLLDLQKAKVVFISTTNLKTLFETNKLDEYEAFFDEYY